MIDRVRPAAAPRRRPDAVAHGRSGMFACRGRGAPEDGTRRSPLGPHPPPETDERMETTTVVAADTPNYPQMLGIESDTVVQEVGWDDDTDDGLREAVEAVIGGEMEDIGTDEVVDVLLLWWREGDGDLVDELMDCISLLSEEGFVWVVTPKTGSPGHVEPSEIAESAPAAGLMQTTNVALGAWTATRLVQPKSKSIKR